jgi:hypothetical protein
LFNARYLVEVELVIQMSPWGQRKNDCIRHVTAYLRPVDPGCQFLSIMTYLRPVDPGCQFLSIMTYLRPVDPGCQFLSIMTSI